jgi:exonuclease 3'-5' domain-containing protein 2
MVNPFNDLPTVGLLDQAGTVLGQISQREAGQLLRRAHAELILQVPPAVRLSIPTETYQSIVAGNTDPDAGKGQYLHARLGALYGNIHFLGPDGETMFHGDAEKALWYLNRGLVEVVSQCPALLRFRFAPGGRGHAGDEYYLSGKVNRCVVCGAVNGLNRHHVVPRVYRRHLPAVMKDHSHHDVLLLCLACHEKYEDAANQLKADIGETFGVPLHGLRAGRDRERGKAVSFARALLRHGEQIPVARREEMLRAIAGWVGTLPSEGDLQNIARMETTAEGGRIEHGEHVVAGISDVPAFIRRWRVHFVRIMQPRFLPVQWDVDRPA